MGNSGALVDFRGRATSGMHPPKDLDFFVSAVKLILYGNPLKSFY